MRIEGSVRRAPRCSGYGCATTNRRDWKIRSWEDLPWAGHTLTLMCVVRSLRCPRCGIGTEQIPFADPRPSVTRRLQMRIGLDCQSMATCQAAVRHRVSWRKAQRAEKSLPERWDRSRPRRRPRHLGADEIQRGRGQRYWTEISDLVHGEVIGLARDRTRASIEVHLDGALDARQRPAVEAVCPDIHRAYVNAAANKLPHAKIVFDRLHVLQHASRAIDNVRRNEFFRAGAIMREYGRGKRGLPLRRWRNLSPDKRRELRDLFIVNRRLFKAHVLREELDRLWTYATPEGVTNFPTGLDHGTSLAAPPRDAEARRIPAPPPRRHHGLLPPPPPPRCRRRHQHHDQGRAPLGARHARLEAAPSQAAMGSGTPDPYPHPPPRPLSRPPPSHADGPLQSLHY